MLRDDADQQAIDSLIRGLTAEEASAAKAKAASRQPAAPPAEARPIHRWTNGPLVMPSMPSHEARRTVALASVIRGISLPALPDLSRLDALVAPAGLARLWVGLGAVHAVAMTFWPYPKTYFWGLALYLLALALVAVTGVWGARLSWDARLGGTHTVAFGIVVWAVALLAAETLPLL